MGIILRLIENKGVFDTLGKQTVIDWSRKHLCRRIKFQMVHRWDQKYGFRETIYQTLYRSTNMALWEMINTHIATVIFSCGKLFVGLSLYG